MLDRAARRVQRLAEAACVAMFAAVFALFLYKIVMRYVFHDPVAWGDEVAVVLFIWIVFVANALVVEDRRQICFDLLYRHVAPPTQRILAVLRILLVGGILACAFPAALDYIAFLWRERTPVLLWRLDLVYACFALFMAAVLLRMAATLLRLLGPRWRDAL